MTGAPPHGNGEPGAGAAGARLPLCWRALLITVTLAVTLLLVGSLTREPAFTVGGIVIVSQLVIEAGRAAHRP